MSLNMRDLTGTQYMAMAFVKEWVATENTPIPSKKIIEYMLAKKISEFTIRDVLIRLVKKGYIRKSIQKKFYIMTRTI